MSNTKLITLDNLTRAVRQIEAELPDTITDEQIEEILETDTTPTLVGPSGVTVSQILNMVYPVGSYYISNNNTSPAQLFGGMWERVQGKFLLGASDNGETGTSLQSTANVAAGSSGGEAAHTLASAEMAAHFHDVAIPCDQTGYSATIPANSHLLHFSSTGGAYWTDSQLTNRGITRYYAKDSFGTQGTYSKSGTTTDRDVGQSHNNMPPFIAAYIWYRIS